MNIKPSGKKSLGSLTDLCEENVRMNLKFIGVNTRNYINSVQDIDYWRTLVNAALNLAVS